MKKIRIILILLIIIWMGVIFNFSHQPGEKSSNTSSSVTKIIAKKIPTKKEESFESKVKRLDPIVRKLAHYSIYLCGGILLIILLHTYKLEKRTKIIISQMLGSMYAITDEIHQYFTPREKL